MDEKTRQLLIEVAGFLRLVRDGVMPADQAKKEAAALMEKIGDSIEVTEELGA